MIWVCFFLDKHQQGNAKVNDKKLIDFKMNPPAGKLTKDSEFVKHFYLYTE